MTRRIDISNLIPEELLILLINVVHFQKKSKALSIIY